MSIILFLYDYITLTFNKEILHWRKALFRHSFDKKITKKEPLVHSKRNYYSLALLFCTQKYLPMITQPSLIEMRKNVVRGYGRQGWRFRVSLGNSLRVGKSRKQMREVVETILVVMTHHFPEKLIQTDLSVISVAKILKTKTL